ncbi:MAG: molybdate ABC transporter substrate-binding protein [Desulfurivibrionaceae bacterium]
MYRVVLFLMTVLSVFPLLKGEPVFSAEIRVSAAASLIDVIPDLKDAYQRKYQEDKIILNFASSGSCYRQIKQGAPVDVYVSANRLFMDKAEKEGLVDRRSRFVFAGNRLVLAVPAGNPARIKNLDDLLLPRVSRIALGTPETVPAGQYARKGLKEKNLWKRLKSKYVYAGHVRSVLAYLKRGNVEAGFIYKTDAGKGAEKTDVVTAVDKAPLVRYWAAVTDRSAEPEAVARFIKFLKTGETADILKQQGFLPSN